jgi:hypothetical protein
MTTSSEDQVVSRNWNRLSLMEWNFSILTNQNREFLVIIGIELQVGLYWKGGRIPKSQMLSEKSGRKVEAKCSNFQKEFKVNFQILYLILLVEKLIFGSLLAINFIHIYKINEILCPFFNYLS